ncbi:hypothetical protein NKH77_13190 [Streptomyces sp. M19]
MERSPSPPSPPSRPPSWPPVCSSPRNPPPPPGSASTTSRAPPGYPRSPDSGSPACRDGHRRPRVRLLAGFWLQDPHPDRDPATSEGVFVFTGSTTPDVAVGDAVLVSGTVSEYYPGGADAGAQSVTELTKASWTVESAGNPLPAAFRLTPRRCPTGTPRTRAAAPSRTCGCAPARTRWTGTSPWRACGSPSGTPRWSAPPPPTTSCG